MDKIKIWTYREWVNVVTFNSNCVIANVKIQTNIQKNELIQILNFLNIFMKLRKKNCFSTQLFSHGSGIYSS